MFSDRCVHCELCAKTNWSAKFWTTQAHSLPHSDSVSSTLTVPNTATAGSKNAQTQVLHLGRCIVLTVLTNRTFSCYFSWFQASIAFQTPRESESVQNPQESLKLSYRASENDIAPSKRPHTSELILYMYQTTTCTHTHQYKLDGAGTPVPDEYTASATQSTQMTPAMTDAFLNEILQR